VVEHVRATHDEEETVVRRYFLGLQLAHEGRRVALDLADARALDDLELRLALALERLLGARAPRVGLASDVPRLSAAEAFEQYQQQGLFAPRPGDPFGLARRLLVETGFDVVHVDPVRPVVPGDLDALVWLQPRRPIEPMLDAALRHLIGGGRLFVAAQHFHIQAQQHAGRGFELVYWPQPQVPDLDRLYFPGLGIELVRSVLFDELCAAIPDDAQIAAGLKRELERQSSALPFVIRAASDGFAPDSPVTAQLSDQAFVWANRIRWSEERLAELGITARALISSSARTWEHAWTGGFLPGELLRPPSAEEDARWLGRVPLLAEFEGSFPTPGEPILAVDDPGASAPWPTSAPGRLLLCGCARIFQDDRLLDARFRGDRLWIAAVSALALAPDLAELAGRSRAARGFGFVPSSTRSSARAAALGGPLLVFLVLGGLWLRARRRGP
jgi:hypothetical protein